VIVHSPAEVLIHAHRLRGIAENELGEGANRIEFKMPEGPTLSDMDPDAFAIQGTINQSVPVFCLGRG
jgi:hypothetical protein